MEINYFRFMSLQFPLFLLALLALLIPILLHLYNNRKHQIIPFSHLFFLDKIKVSSKKPSRLQKKILLFARLLLLSVLIIAFAQPFFKNTDASKNKGIPILFLDQSPSMSVTKNGRSLWDQVKNDAMDILSSMNEDDEVILLSTTQPMAFQPVSKEEAMKQVKALNVSDQFIPIDQLFRNIQITEEEIGQEGGEVFVFSNFQQSTWSNDSLRNVLPNNFHLLAYDFGTTQNYWIDTAYIAESDAQNRLHFKVLENIDTSLAADLTVQLYINKRLFQSLQIESLDTAEYLMELPVLKEHAQLQLVLQDPYVSFDDTLFLTYYPQQALPISLISDQGINRFYQVLSQSVNALAFEKITTQQLEADQSNLPFIIFEASSNTSIKEQRLLKEYVSSGGVVLWMPTYSQSKSSMELLLNEWTAVQVDEQQEGDFKVQRMEIQHPIIQEIFEDPSVARSLPEVYRYFPLNFKGNQPVRSLFTLQNGQAFMSELSVGKGKIYILSTSLDLRATNFVQTYLFAPLLYTMAQQHHFQWPLYLTNESTRHLMVSNLDYNYKEPWRIVAENTDVIPKQQEWRNGKQLEIAPYQLAKGWYDIQQMKDEKGDYELAYNLSPTFSNLKSINEDGFRTMLPSEMEWKYWSGSEAELPKSLSSTSNAWSIWQWLAGLAILVLLFDTLWTYRDRT